MCLLQFWSQNIILQIWSLVEVSGNDLVPDPSKMVIYLEPKLQKLAIPKD